MNIGDVVMLKSGGIEMTVTSIDKENKKANCMWMDWTGSSGDISIPIACLKTPPPPEPKDQNPKQDPFGTLQ